MSGYQLKNDEIILFEGQVKLDGLKSDIKFTLTSQKMIFEKEKGIFRKKLKVIDEIPLDNVKMYKDKVQISQNKTILTIQTISKTITFSCSNVIDARKIVENIINIKTGSNALERGKNTLQKIVRTYNESKEVVVTIVGIVLAIKKYFDKRK